MLSVLNKDSTEIPAHPPEREILHARRDTREGELIERDPVGRETMDGGGRGGVMERDPIAQKLSEEPFPLLSPSVQEQRAPAQRETSPSLPSSPPPSLPPSLNSGVHSEERFQVSQISVSHISYLFTFQVTSDHSCTVPERE